MADRIQLTGIKVFAGHGVLPHEEEFGQPFSIDITCWLDFADAARDDDLHKTVNYSSLAALAVRTATDERFDLIETLAARIADAAMSDYGQLHAVEVTVHKPHAPIGLLIDDISVTARRSHKSRYSMPPATPANPHTSATPAAPDTASNPSRKA